MNKNMNTNAIKPHIRYGTKRPEPRMDPTRHVNPTDKITKKQMKDSLSNLFSHLNNAQQNRILTIVHPKSKLIIAILNVLQAHGYIRGYSLNTNKNLTSPKGRKTTKETVEILLKYTGHRPAIKKIIRLSKSSKRFYVKATDLTKKNSIKEAYMSNLHGTHGQKKEFLFMQGILVLSTSKGIVSDMTAHKLNLGGEVLCQIY